MNTFHLHIITPDKIIYDGHVQSLVAPGTDGYLGILAHHTPLLTTLMKGFCIVTEAPKKKLYYKVTGGFLEVSNNQASLLVNSIETTAPIDMMSGI